jgi:hypothetical protein
MLKIYDLKKSLNKENPMEIKLELVKLVEGYKPFGN